MCTFSINFDITETSQLMPTVLKSAVQSANTVVFVPSSLDFIRVHNHFRKNVGASFTVLSEYVDQNRTSDGCF